LKFYLYDTNRGIKVDHLHGLVEINEKVRLTTSLMFLFFAKQCQQVYYIYTHSFRKDHNIVDWLSIVKTKPKSHVQVVEDEVIGGDDVFQMDELVDAYRVALFAEIENLDFYVIKNTYIDVDVDVDELNIILSISIHRKNNNEWWDWHWIQ